MKITRILANNRSPITKLFIVLMGVFIGHSISTWVRDIFEYNAVRHCVTIRQMSHRVIYSRPRELFQEVDTKKLLFVGIMTAEKFLNSRASVVYKTWGSSVPGKLEFFTGNKSVDDKKLPVVSLRGVDDSYPPQRKSLMMLKYMYDNFIDQYEWFMRCDDDVYVRTDELEELLRGFDSSEELFIGQAGQGTPSERGRLGLKSNDNFCMGGPGIIMSRSVLKKLGPHLEYCLEHLVSSHEDVEVGRCVRRHVGIACTWAYEMQWIFYHNQSQTNAFHWDLDTKAVQNAITLHPIKNPAYMYRIHTHFLTQKILTVQHRSSRTTNIIRNLKKLTQTTLTKPEVTKLQSKKDLNQNVPINATLQWELFSPKKLFSVRQSPTIAVDNSLKMGLNFALRKSLAQINLEARKVIFRELLLSKLNLGYVRLVPTQGLQYIFDFRMVMYQHIGYSRRKLPINVHYQAHAQLPFGNLIYTSRTTDKTIQPYVNIILPLAGRLEAFERFLLNFEQTVLLRNEKVRLLVMYFPKVSHAGKHKNLLKIYTDRYYNFEVIWQTVKGEFSRGLALQLGVSHFHPDSLLFFCDVDLAFHLEFLNRCRLNTLKGKRVYYPMVFSQFNQTISVKSRKNLGTSDSYQFNNENLEIDHGFWRMYGFGIVCVYGDDINKIGGFDLSIKGWGLEDVRLYSSFVSSGRYDVIRTPDPGLVHIYHVSSCSADLEPSRLKSCHASARSQLANAGSLVDYMTLKGYL